MREGSVGNRSAGNGVRQPEELTKCTYPFKTILPNYLPPGSFDALGWGWAIRCKGQAGAGHMELSLTSGGRPPQREASGVRLCKVIFVFPMSQERLCFSPQILLKEDPVELFGSLGPAAKRETGTQAWKRSPGLSSQKSPCGSTACTLVSVPTLPPPENLLLVILGFIISTHLNLFC